MKLPSGRALTRILEKFPGKRLLIVGDVMLDHFIRGKVERISPEAPVPVVQVSQESFVPGGAGNVAANLAALMAKVRVISVLGNDEAGRKLVEDLEAIGVDVRSLLKDPERPTTVKVRVIAEHQQVVRFDREKKAPLPKDLKALALRTLEEAARETDAVILSDYGKGMLTPDILSAAIAAARRRSIPVVVDPKVEHFMKYRGVTCLTPNVQEAWGGMRLTPKTEEKSFKELGGKILRRLRADSVLITRGEKGMSLFQNGSEVNIPTMAREVYDVTGAGDTVVSVLSLALASGASLVEAAILSNLAAGIVVGKLGTATVSLDELTKAAERGYL